MVEKQDRWATRIGLILAMAGNAVGLGNFLRFPVQAIENGGGAFIIPYLVCFFLMGIPLLWIEWATGRYGGKFGNHSTPFIFDTMTRSSTWKYIGVFGIFTNIAVVSYYCYIESWTLAYVMHSLLGSFKGLDQLAVANFFNQYVGTAPDSSGIPAMTLVFFVLTIGVNTFVLSNGLKGVEKVARVGMPMLLIFGAILAVRGLTLGDSGASAAVPDANAWDGINFLWEVQFTSLGDPKVWLAAAGQIFFTLGLGWGTIQCYAAYVESKQDIALNAVTAGFMNEFVEVVLGSLIIIPISVGFLGLDWVKEHASFGMGFQTMPYLFQQWGAGLGALAGLLWFGLLFFAGITSSLAMGTPWVGFMKDEFNWSNAKGAWSFGMLTLLMGLPTVLFYQYGVFDEYDYWAGTVSLVVFAMLETILFSWIFGVEKGWKEINEGSDIRIPVFFKFIIRFITPMLILVVFIGAVITPENNDWTGNLLSLSKGEGWQFDANSIVSKLSFGELKQRMALTTDPQLLAELKKERFYANFARISLLSLFLFIALLVALATRKRKKERRVK